VKTVIMRSALLLLGALVACSGTGCASAPSRTPAAVPLEIPDPPPRASIEPLPLPGPPQPAPPDRPASRPTTAEPAARANRPATSPPPLEGNPAALPEPPAPPAELSAGAEAGAPSASRVREILTRTQQKLDAIDRGKLSAGKQTDYDTARRFAAQAEVAIKANNLLLARYSAEKAEALANGLR
jgi:hypothetical protein